VIFFFFDLDKSLTDLSILFGRLVKLAIKYVYFLFFFFLSNCCTVVASRLVRHSGRCSLLNMVSTTLGYANTFLSQYVTYPPDLSYLYRRTGAMTPYSSNAYVEADNLTCYRETASNSSLFSTGWSLL
jgi:hypothetical protein